jgi:2-methylisocitrate lyase-like PEP mutase family enzyme
VAHDFAAVSSVVAGVAGLSMCWPCGSSVAAAVGLPDLAAFTALTSICFEATSRSWWAVDADGMYGIHDDPVRAPQEDVLLMHPWCSCGL